MQYCMGMQHGSEKVSLEILESPDLVLLSMVFVMGIVLDVFDGVDSIAGIGHTRFFYKNV